MGAEQVELHRLGVVSGELDFGSDEGPVANCSVKTFQLRKCARLDDSPELEIGLLGARLNLIHVKLRAVGNDSLQARSMEVLVNIIFGKLIHGGSQDEVDP